MENLDLAMGKFASFITKGDEVRIEGTICHFSQYRSAIILSNATCYGSEGRERNRRSNISACNQIPGYVYFRIRDLKDLEVILLPPNMLNELEADFRHFPPLSRPHLHRRHDLPRRRDLPRPRLIA